MTMLCHMSNDTSCFVGRSTRGAAAPVASTPSTGTFRVTLGENSQSLLANVDRRIQVSVEYESTFRTPVRPLIEAEHVLHMAALRASFARREPSVDFDVVPALVREQHAKFRHATLMSAFSYRLHRLLHSFDAQVLAAHDAVVLGNRGGELVHRIHLRVSDSLVKPCDVSPGLVPVF